VARQLRELGFDAAALQGGYQAWRTIYPVEPKGKVAVADVITQSGGGSAAPPSIVPEQLPVSSTSDDKMTG
jgi:hypothetical protein